MKRGFVSKQGQVGIIAVVLIILISLTAIVILWNLFGGLVNESSKDIEGNLLTVGLEVKDVVFFMTGSSKVGVSRNVGGGEIDGLKFVFYDADGNSEVRDVEWRLEELDTKSFSFSPLEIREVKRVSVYPVYMNNIGREFKAEVNRVIEVPSGLVSWWRFENNKDFVDGNDGELIGGSSINEGKLILSGGYFSIKDSDTLDLDEGVSISVWVEGNSDGEIVGKGEDYKVSLRNGKVVFSYNGNEFESYEEIEGGWNHILVSADFNGIFKMFVNGETVSDFVNLGGGIVNDDDLKIGFGFVGEIDEVMVFNKASSVEQVEGLYKFGKE